MEHSNLTPVTKTLFFDGLNLIEDGQLYPLGKRENALTRILSVLLQNLGQAVSVETLYQVSSDIDSYSEGWKYFCLILPAKAWKSTQFTICFYKNIGTLSIDGLQLTRNDVQSRKYDSEGSLTSSYTALKTDSYTYDTYKRTKKHTTAAGAYYINTYANNNELKKVEASIGPDTYYEYDK